MEKKREYTVNELYSIFQEKTFDIFTVDFLQWVARTRDFGEMSLLNRLLCYTQVGKPDMVKTEEWWMSIGRDLVRPPKKTIYGIESIDVVKYYDSETGEELERTGLGAKETTEALRYGLIKKEVESIGAKVVRYYTFGDTVTADQERFERIKSIYESRISLNRIFGVMSKLGVEFAIGGEEYVGSSYYTGEKVIIGKDDYEKQVNAIVDGITDSLELGVDEHQQRIARKIIRESIRSFVTKDKSVDLSDIENDLEVETLMASKELLGTINEAYNISNEIIQMLSPKELQIDSARLRKLDKLLSIIEASSARALIGE